MRPFIAAFLAITLGLCLLASSALAAPAPLSFERGDTVLFNPTNDDVVLRSATLDKVRLQLWRAPNDTAENQIVTARALHSVTENGLLGRMMGEQNPIWQSDFVLPDASEAVTLPIPLMAAANALTPGDYVLVALTGTGERAMQWFSLSPLLPIAQKLDDGKVLTAVVDAKTAAPLADAVVVALNAKGEIIGGARANETGGALWDLPADTVALRAEHESDTGRWHAFFPLPVATPAPVAKKNPVIVPQFSGHGAPAGATARFIIKPADGNSAIISYSFIQESYRFEWRQDKNDEWVYKTITVPATMQQGTLQTRSDAPAELALPVGEGRYRLTVRQDGDKADYVFTAGWWRDVQLPVADFSAPQLDKAGQVKADGAQLWLAAKNGNDWHYAAGAGAAVPQNAATAAIISCRADKDRAACRSDNVAAQ